MTPNEHRQKRETKTEREKERKKNRVKLLNTIICSNYSFGAVVLTRQLSLFCTLVISLLVCCIWHGWPVCLAPANHILDKQNSSSACQKQFINQYRPNNDLWLSARRAGYSTLFCCVCVRGPDIEQCHKILCNAKCQRNV